MTSLYIFSGVWAQEFIYEWFIYQVYSSIQFLIEGKRVLESVDASCFETKIKSVGISSVFVP